MTEGPANYQVFELKFVNNFFSYCGYRYTNLAKNLVLNFVNRNLSLNLLKNVSLCQTVFSQFQNYFYIQFFSKYIFNLEKLKT